MKIPKTKALKLINEKISLNATYNNCFYKLKRILRHIMEGEKTISNPCAKKHSQTWLHQGISPLNHLYEHGPRPPLLFGLSGHQ